MNAPLFFLLISCQIFLASMSHVQEKNAIASRYPGDEGIESDPDVLFVENFEDPMDVILKHWSDVRNREGYRAVSRRAARQQWQYPMGGAGIKPKGDDKFIIPPVQLRAAPRASCMTMSSSPEIIQARCNPPIQEQA